MADARGGGGVRSAAWKRTQGESTSINNTPPEQSLVPSRISYNKQQQQKWYNDIQVPPTVSTSSLLNILQQAAPEPGDLPTLFHLSGVIKDILCINQDSDSGINYRLLAIPAAGDQGGYVFIDSPDTIHVTRICSQDIHTHNKRQKNSAASWTEAHTRITTTISWYVVQYHSCLLDQGFPLVFRKTYATCLMDHSILSRYDLSNKNFPRFQSWDSIGEDMFVSAQVLKFWNGKPISVDTDKLKTTPKAYRCDGTDEDEESCSSIWDLHSLPFFLDANQYIYLLRSFRIMGAADIMETANAGEYDCGVQDVVLSPVELLSASQNDIVKFLSRFVVSFNLCEHIHHQVQVSLAAGSALDCIAYSISKFGKKVSHKLMFWCVTVLSHIALTVTDYGEFEADSYDYILHLVHFLQKQVTWAEEYYHLYFELIYRLFTRKVYKSRWICDQDHFYQSHSCYEKNRERFLYTSFELLSTAAVCTRPKPPDTNRIKMSMIQKAVRFLLLPEEEVFATSFMNDKCVDHQNLGPWTRCKTRMQIHTVMVPRLVLQLSASNGFLENLECAAI